jgi:DNA processing protein
MKYARLIAGSRMLTAAHADYPRGLERLPDGEKAPLLYAVGDVPAAPAVAVVGTRSPDAPGLELARRLARECALRNVPVVSGGANGIDSAAHRGCIEAGGKTVVVFAGGFEKPHPPGNRSLFFEAVDRGGCLISEHPPAVPARRFLFLRRNRIIAALAECVVIVQARFRSGALSTAAWANRCSVRLLASGGSPLSPLFQGTNGLIAARKAEILATLESPFTGPLPRPRRKGPPGPLALQPPPAGLGRDEKKILRTMGDEPMTIDKIAETLDMEVRRVAGALLDLEMKGAVRAADPGRYVLVR